MEMMDYIKQQTPVLGRILANRVGYVSKFVTLFKENRPDHIYLIASGTSKNASKAASPFMEKVLGVEVSSMSSSSASSFFGKRPLLIYVSQGGNSTNTISAIKRNKGYLSIALTGNENGAINTMCENYCEIPCGEENVGPKTKGYTSTILLLYLFALEASLSCSIIARDQYDDAIASLEKTISAIDENIDRSICWIESNRQELEDTRCAYIVGKGCDSEVSKESALKLMETLLIPSCGFEFEEFLHGPSCSIDKDISGFYFMPQKNDVEDYNRFQSLIKYHRNYSSSVFSIGNEEPCDKRNLNLILNDNIYLRPFEYIIPMQIISAMIPQAKSLDGVGHDRFATLNAILKTKAKQE